MNILDKITVLSVCYNSKDVLVRSLAPFMGAKQVIIVDNASADGSADFIEQALPGVTLIRNQTNKGYGGAVNTALFQVKTPYLLFVTPDVKLSIEDLILLYQALEKYENAAIVSPQIYVPRQGIENWVMGPSEYAHTKADFKPEGDFSTWFQSGTANLCRTKALQDIGGFDENIFLYHEDLDLCHRVTRSGHSIVCVCAAVVRHHNSQSAGAPSPKLHWRKDWNFAWGALYILDKYAGRSAMLKHAFKMLRITPLKALFYVIVLDKKRFIRDGAATAGCIAYLLGLKPGRPK